ncbi:MAG: hypothetical protein OHK0039_28790 [Bacteroidia bacterium]
MLEIIALVYLTRQIGNRAEDKGLPKTRWKVYTVLAWFGMELLGGIVGGLMNLDLILTVVLALLFAFGGYLLVRYLLDQQPDPTDNQDLIDRIGATDDDGTGPQDRGR